MPSWKYLYQLNKDKIGDNPDLLKAGTELTIPQWDSTQGDELIREKGGNPMAYTGGLQYRYPWVPFSLSLKNEFNEPVVEYDEKGEIREEFSKPIKLCIVDAKRNVKIAEVEASKKFDEIELLIPDAQSIIITSEEPDTRPGTLKELIKILEGIESEEGPEAASHFAFYLNYEKICELVKKGGKDNDPNLMPTRFMLLPGMSDSSIKQIDNHPDSPAGKPPFQMNVANLRKSLNLLGFAVKDGSVFDASMLDPLLQYLRTLQARRKYSGISTYTVQVGDTIGSIASDFGLPSWRYLYKINKGTIGSDPNVLKTGIEIEIPQWDTTSGDEKMLNAGFDVFSFCNGAGFRYPWVSFSFKMNDDSGKPMTSFSKPTKVNIIDRKSKKSLFKSTVTNFSDLEMLLPDSEDINIGIEGMSFSINETEHNYQE
jgi:LysM repeat protein